MALVIITFLLVYGGMHLHFFLRFRAAFGPGTAGQLLLVGLLLVGILTPVLVRTAERLALEETARGLAWVGYGWMAVLLLFVLLSCGLELYRVALWGTGRMWTVDPSAWQPSPRTRLLLPLLAALALAGYGFFEARQIRVERLEVQSAKLSRSLGPVRVVQISDLHIGVLVRGERLKRVVQAIREAEPDLLVSTGDLLDGQGNELSEAAAQLRDLRPRLGKYAVLGNHEFYVGLDRALAFTAAAGFTMLRNELAIAADTLALAGVDDPTVRPPVDRGGRTDREILAANGGRFTILLKHQPIVEGDATGGFDLQLSGHTHAGQIFPFALLPRLAYRYFSGTYRLEGGALIHVSRGTGTWGPPVRFLAPPQITVIDLVPA